MIILTNPINLYGKKVVTDLATRSGNSTVNDFSCGLGLAYKVRELWPDNQSDANMEMLFNNQDDYNADVSQPTMTDEDYDEVIDEEEHDIVTPYNPAIDKTDFNRYYRRLEDIANDYLEKYVGYLVYNIRNHSDGIKMYNSKHQDQPLLMSNGDDDNDFTEIADLQLVNDDEDWPLYMKQAALQNLPYVIKRLHNMSCYVGVHMLSFVVSFIKAKDKNSRLRIAGSTKTLKKNAVIEEGVYLCDKRGNITKKVLVQNKNRRAAEMFDWIVGASKEYAAYYQDYLDFVHYCKVLNIDIYNDDMTRYQSAFVDSLIVTTVTPNKQYDKQVFDAILGNGTNVMSDSDGTVDPLENTIEIFQQVCETSGILRDYIPHHDSVKAQGYLEIAKSIYNTYMLLSKGVTTDSSKYYWDSGYLFYDGNIVTMSASLISDPESRPFTNDLCIVSELGYCVQVTSLMSLYIMAIPCASSNLLNKVTYKDPEYKYVDWLRVGT